MRQGNQKTYVCVVCCEREIKSIVEELTYQGHFISSVLLYLLLLLLLCLLLCIVLKFDFYAPHGVFFCRWYSYYFVELTKFYAF